VNRRKLCVVTTSRADYGLLYWLMKEIRSDDALQLQLIVTGMHLAPEFGLTYRQVEKDGFTIDRRIDMLLSSDSEKAIVKSIGIGLLGFSDALDELQPDIMVVLGDRFELLSATISALSQRIPIAHIHGGETSQGAIDEAVRHSITKMATMHFPATEVYRERIVQMGEDPDLVFNYGAPGLDNIYRLPLLNRVQLEGRLKFDLSGTVAMVTYHPVTLEKNKAADQAANILDAMTSTGIKAVFTKANADAHGREINRILEAFCDANEERFRIYDNLGQLVYLSCLQNLDLMIGNSSSGLTEAPSFSLPVVNIGDRQKGRIRATNIIDVGYTVEEIVNGIRLACTETFRKRIAGAHNPYSKYADGKTSYRIKEKLKEIELSESLFKKTFHDYTLEVQQ
jgi:UDP-hydrolysing UDP-N-acetyl-D-glucosamine 2-epimerase